MHATKLSMFLQKKPFMKLTTNQVRDGQKNLGLAVVGSKTALVDKYATAVIHGEGKNAASNSAAAKPIQHKVSITSMTLERDFCVVSRKAITACLFHTVNTC